MLSIIVLLICYSIWGYLVLILLCTIFGVFNIKWNSCDDDLVVYYRNLQMDFPVPVHYCVSVCHSCVYSVTFLSFIFYCYKSLWSETHKLIESLDMPVITVRQWRIHGSKPRVDRGTDEEATKTPNGHGKWRALSEVGQWQNHPIMYHTRLIAVNHLIKHLPSTVN